MNSHKRNRKTLQHHMQLVELLEVPQLVDACARNGFHEEALELANFVNGLERRHLLAAEVRSIDGKVRGGSSVVQSIVDVVHSTLLGLRQQLLGLLTEHSSLPKELQILGTLRKLDGLLIDRQLELERRENEALAGLSEKQRDALRQHFIKAAETRLQMNFLEARTVWLQRMVDKAMSGEANAFNLSNSLLTGNDFGSVATAAADALASFSTSSSSSSSSSSSLTDKTTSVGDDGFGASNSGVGTGGGGH